MKIANLIALIAALSLIISFVSAGKLRKESTNQCKDFEVFQNGGCHGKHCKETKDCGEHGECDLKANHCIEKKRKFRNAHAQEGGACKPDAKNDKEKCDSTYECKVDSKDPKKHICVKQQIITTTTEVKPKRGEN